MALEDAPSAYLPCPWGYVSPEQSSKGGYWVLSTGCDFAFRASAVRATSAKALGSVTALAAALAVESLTPLLVDIAANNDDLADPGVTFD